MSLEEDVVAHLTSAEGVPSAIFHMQAPPKTQPPFVTYQRVGTAEEASFSGSSNLARAVLQFDAYGMTATQARLVGMAIRAALHGINLPAFKSTVTNQLELAAGETGLYRRTVEAAFWHKPT